MKDFFQTFQLERRFSIDINDLDTRYRALQNTFHPDRYVGESAQQQQLAIQVSADLNAGYSALKNSLSRAQHLLALYRQGTTGEKKQTDPAMLMEQMELNEQLESVDSDVEFAELTDQIQSDIASVEAQLASIFDGTIKQEQQYAEAEAPIERLQFLSRMLERVNHKRYGT